MMINANTPEFLAQYPNYCKVYDARGRQVPLVKACNPETGEVIRMDGSWLTGQWLRLTRPRWRLGATTNHGFMWMVCGCGPMCKHGFWPAPLRLVPNPPYPAGGFVGSNAPYIVGNGEREHIINKIETATADTKQNLTLAMLDELIDAMEGEE